MYVAIVKFLFSEMVIFGVGCYLKNTFPHVIFSTIIFVFDNGVQHGLSCLIYYILNRFISD